jgi:hypothetical protein
MERRTTPYVASKAKPFASSGTRLGGIVPEVVTIGDEGESSVPKLTESGNFQFIFFNHIRI